MSYGPVPTNVAETLAYPACVKCGAPWQCLGDGPLDYLWCTSPSHGTIWLHARDSGRAIAWEIRGLDGKGYTVRWDCDCARPQCNGRGAVFEETDYDNPTEAGVWYFDAPFSMTLDDVRSIVSRTPDEWE